MLRASTRTEIEALLDASYFSSANFSITTGRSERQVFEIAFVPNPEFRFIVESRGSPVYPFDLHQSPGPNVLKGDYSMKDSMDMCLKEIPGWVERIKEEVLASNPLSREVQQLREEVEQRLNLLGQALDSFFTREEAATLSAKLDVLNGELSRLSAENAALKEAAAQLEGTVSQLRAALEQVNRGTWFRMALGKLTSFTKSLFTSKEAREFALEAAKKIFLEGPK
jgi:methyl-accepting chemotaxis protein